jgi:hypothetical protein
LTAIPSFSSTATVSIAAANPTSHSPSSVAAASVAVPSIAGLSGGNSGHSNIGRVSFAGVDTVCTVREYGHLVFRTRLVARKETVSKIIQSLLASIECFRYKQTENG